MRNTFLSILATLTIIGLVASCGEKKQEVSEEEEMVEWKELDEFHAVMADVFHPLKDSGNVSIYMERATELADAAEKWAGATLPRKVDTEEVKAMLAQLKADTRTVANEIANGAEEDYAGTELHKLHDLFHKIQEAWYGGGEHERNH